MKSEPITTALLLAAGAGNRLLPLTQYRPKCLTMVAGCSILERLVRTLRSHGIKRLVVVIGHQGSHIRAFLAQNAGDLNVDYVVNPVYRTTNNIYSLWLARHQLRESFLLLETDLVFDPEMLKRMLRPDRIAVSTLSPWMNGTTVLLDRQGRVTAFQLRKGIKEEPRFKTVNVYSISQVSWKKIALRLSRYVSEKRLGEYYEAVFAEMVDDGSLSLEAVKFDAHRWYEIDTIMDLAEATKLFERKTRLAPYPSVLNDGLAPDG